MSTNSTANRPSYADLLKHPLWQRKRLEILERNDFHCEACGEGDKTLHIHHGYYDKSKKPWEYKDETLHALCRDCHVDVEERLKRVREQIGKLGGHKLEQLFGYALGLEIQDADPLVRFVVGGAGVAEGVAAVFLVDEDALVRAVIESGDCAIDQKTIESLPRMQRSTDGT